MKRPILSEFERFMIREKTTYGAGLIVRLASLKFKREFEKTKLFNLLKNTVIYLNKLLLKA